MTLTIFKESDVDAGALSNRKVAVIGYGNQGHAHALNLRDAGVQVVVGQRPGASYDRARDDGFEPIPVDDAAQWADLLIVALPDESAAEIFEQQMQPHLRPGQILGFIHGFNIHFGYIQPPDRIDTVMVAPKGPGVLLRSLYLQNKGLPALLAVHRDESGDAGRVALTWAAAIGCMRASVIQTTFASETVTDLFGEQAVLCGGVAALAKTAFGVLMEAGYDPVSAYFECVHELKQTVDLLYSQGLSGMRERVSNTAAFGDLTRGPKVIDETVRENMKQILEEVRSGTFAKEWITEYRSGSARMKALLSEDADSVFERTGRTVRSLVPWLA